MIENIEFSGFKGILLLFSVLLEEFVSSCLSVTVKNSFHKELFTKFCINKKFCKDLMTTTFLQTFYLNDEAS
jgi:hypothetical protein